MGLRTWLAWKAESKRAFSFAKKRTITICGKAYECDSTNNDLLRGAALDFPKILECAKELAQLRDSKNLKAALDKNETLLGLCKTFIVGCLGDAEYAEIFNGRRTNTSDHVQLCTYIYGFILRGRVGLVREYTHA